MDDLIRRIDAIHALTQSSDYIADALERLEKVPTVNAVIQENTRFIRDAHRIHDWHCEACGFTRVLYGGFTTSAHVAARSY